MTQLPTTTPAAPPPSTAAIQSDRAKPPNWVEIGVFWCRVVTGLSVFFLALIFGLTQRAEILEVLNRNDEPLPAIECDVLEPQTYIGIDGNYHEAVPVMATVTNHGLYPVHVESVTCTLRRASVAAVTNLQPIPDLVAESEDEVQFIGFIDTTIDNWHEFDRKQAHYPAWDIPPGQSRRVTFYVISSFFKSDEFVRAYVTISPGEGNEWAEQTWQGFIDQYTGICYPDSSPAGQDYNDPDYSPGAEDAPPGPTDANLEAPPA
jgi:hypothetical protein